MFRFALWFVGLMALIAAPALADPLIGTWRTEPDRKNLTSLIRVVPCDGALCGVVAKALGAAGRDVKTAHVGQTLFWGLRPKCGGTYDDGTVRVPMLNITASARAELNGDRLRVTGCKGALCDGQTWVPVR